MHRCDFCGWSRNAGSAAMTAPRCDACGCGLTSLRRSDIPVPLPSDLEELQRLLPRVGPEIKHALRLAFVVLITAAAARWGFGEGGPAIAIVAFGIAGLFAVPIAVPGRYGGPDVDSARDDAAPAPAGLPSRHA
ncbi:MAG: hypothetical protein WD844_06775 [Thermoleophilaceae bacterium]